MNANELIKALSNLSDEDRELEVMSLEEIWWCSVVTPHAGYIDERNEETKDNSGQRIIMIS